MTSIIEVLDTQTRLQTVGDPRSDAEVREGFRPHAEDLQAVEDAWKALTGEELFLGDTECAFDSSLADLVLEMKAQAFDRLLLDGEDGGGAHWLERVVPALEILLTGEPASTREQRVRRAALRRLMEARSVSPNGDYDYDDLVAIVEDGAHCGRYAAITYDETYTFITVFEEMHHAARHLETSLGDEVSGGSIDGVVDLDTGEYFRADAKVDVTLVRQTNPHYGEGSL